MNEQGNVHIANAPTGATATEPTADDIALILHTSGSTGRPKRVPLRHFNQQAEYFYKVSGEINCPILTGK